MRSTIAPPTIGRRSSIAEVIGGAVVGRAALAACGIEEEQSLGSMLLRDIRETFAENGGGHMPSADLVAALVAMADRPWGEIHHPPSLC